MSYYSGDRTSDYRQMGWQKPGINATGEYQVSGQPFVLQYTPPINGGDGDGAASGLFADDKIMNDAAAAIHFPQITKRLVVENKTNGDLLIYFCSLMVPVFRAAAADVDKDDAAIPSHPTSRGNRITTTELDAYNGSGAGEADKRPNSTVKINKHYYTIPTGQTLDVEVKCRKVFVVQAAGGNQAACNVRVELTSIEEQYDCDFRGLPGISGGARGTKFLESQEA